MVCWVARKVRGDEFCQSPAIPPNRKDGEVLNLTMCELNPWLRCRPSLPAIHLTLCRSWRKRDPRRGLICCNLQDCSHTAYHVEVRRCP